MDELKIAWESFASDSDQAKLLQVVEKYIPDDFDPDYGGSDEWGVDTMDAPYLETHRVCDIELCDKFFRVTRTSDPSETLSITPTNSPALDVPGIPYSLTGKKLMHFIQGKQRELEEACARDSIVWEAEQAERNRKDLVPICSSIVRFIPKDTRFDSCGEIVMKAVDILQQCKNDEIKNWLSNRDESQPSETVAPRQWRDSFEYLAYSLLEKKKVDVWCSNCQKEYSANEITEDVDPYPIGWINGRFLCPKNHILLEIELMHLS